MRFRISVRFSFRTENSFLTSSRYTVCILPSRASILETVKRYPGSAELIHHGFQVVYDCDPFIHTGCYDEIRHSHPRLSRLA